MSCGRKRVQINPRRKKTLEKCLEKDNGSYRKVALSNDISKSVLNRNLKKSSENPDGVVSFKIQEDKNVSITPKTQEHRLNYSHSRINSSFDDTLFFDETKILLDGEPNSQNTRDRRTPHSTKPRRTKRKRTGNAGFNVGIGFSYKEKMDIVFFADGPRVKKRRVGDPGKLVFDHESNNHNSFVRRAVPKIVNFYHKNHCDQYVADGHKVHLNQSVIEKLEENGVNRVPFAGAGEGVLNGYPESSNDFMPVECVIHDLKELVWAKNPETMVQLYKAIKSAWSALSMDCIESQIDRLDRTFAECIARRGLKTHY